MKILFVGTLMNYTRKNSLYMISKNEKTRSFFSVFFVFLFPKENDSYKLFTFLHGINL